MSQTQQPFSVTPNQLKELPQTAQFMARYEAEKLRGLVDVKFFITNTDDATLEKVFEEANLALNTPAATTAPSNDPDFF
jgi:hypothetical protein